MSGEDTQKIEVVEPPKPEPVEPVVEELKRTRAKLRLMTALSERTLDAFYHPTLAPKSNPATLVAMLRQAIREAKEVLE